MTGKAKYILLTLLFTLGFSLPGCFNCNCPEFRGDYFYIRDLQVENHKEPGQYFFSINFDISYYSSAKVKAHPTHFSFINSAFACSCMDNGSKGSKEKLKELIVITKNDFDNRHLANDIINDLLDIQINADRYDLQSYLQQDTSAFMYRNYALFLKKQPELNKEFKVEVRVTLDNGEVFQSMNQPILLE